jgi:hypothetical protein
LRVKQRNNKPLRAENIQIGAHELRWTLIRDAQWHSKDDYQGIAISVSKAGATRRELILKYPYLGAKRSGAWHLPDKPKVTPEIVAGGIRAAIEAGWDPDSRGKSFTFQVPENTFQFTKS